MKEVFAVINHRSRKVAGFSLECDARGAFDQTPDSATLASIEMRNASGAAHVEIIESKAESRI